MRPVCFRDSQFEQYDNLEKDLLLHLCKCLTSYSFPAFPIRLLVGEVDGAMSQHPLLHHPTSLVQRSLENMLIEIIQGSANKKRGLIHPLERHKFPTAAFSLIQKTMGLTLRTARSKNTISRAENIFHAVSLLLEISIVRLISLYNTNGIDPDILKA